jgi:hypothetical protein
MSPPATIVSAAFAECRVGYEAVHADGHFAPLVAVLIANDGSIVRITINAVDWSLPGTIVRERAMLPSSEFAHLAQAISEKVILRPSVSKLRVTMSDSRGDVLVVGTHTGSVAVSTSSGDPRKIESASAIIDQVREVASRVPHSAWHHADSVPFHPENVCKQQRAER